MCVLGVCVCKRVCFSPTRRASSSVLDLNCAPLSLIALPSPRGLLPTPRALRADWLAEMTRQGGFGILDEWQLHRVEPRAI